MVWNTEVFVKELNLPGFKLIVESVEIPPYDLPVQPTPEKRQKFVDGLASWVGMKNLQVQEIAWEVADMQFGVTVRTQNEYPELKKEVAFFDNKQIAYMLTHGVFAQYAYDKYFWVEGERMPTADEKTVVNDTLSVMKETKVFEDLAEPLKEAPFPQKLMLALASMQVPNITGLVGWDSAALPRETVLRHAHSYLRGIVRYYGNGDELLRYKWIELKEYPATSEHPAEKVPCTREEATHVVVGIERPGHCAEFILDVAAMVKAARCRQLNPNDFDNEFWLPIPFNWAEPLKESEGLDEYFTSAIDNIDGKEKVELEFHHFQEKLSQLMATTLHRATDGNLPQKNDGFIPLRAVNGLLEDFKDWLYSKFGSLIRNEVGAWDMRVFISDATTLTLEVTETLSYRRFIVTYNYDDFFKGHIAAGLDWHPEARTFWRLPS